MFAGLSLDSAFGKSGKHKTASEKNGNIDRTDNVVNNGPVWERDMHRYKQN